MKIEAFTHSWDTILAILVCFGCSLISMTYFVGFIFSNSNNAFRQIGIFYLVVGYFIPNTLGSVITVITGGAAFSTIRYILFIDPFFPFYESLIWIVFKQFHDKYPDQIDWDLIDSYFIYKPAFACVAMLVMAVVYFTLAVIIDSYKLGKFRGSDSKIASWFPRYLQADNDVLSEAAKVERDHGENGYQVKVQNVQKVYSNGFPAVSGTSFGIKEHQVLGLLGPNGAGKSTTFSMLTMEQNRSSGQITVLGNPVENFNLQRDGNRLGLCAQQNLIWDNLTVDEHLNFIGAVKGLTRQEIA